MSGRSVQQFLARCVVDPPFFEAAIADLEAALASFDLTEQERLDFARLDLGRVRSFAGLITKVQNNGLWHTFPSTRLLIDHYGLDLELFTDYRLQHQLDRGAAPVDHTERTRHFAAFFPEWVAARGVHRWPGLLDVFHHERMWLEQRLALADEPGWPNRAPRSLVAEPDSALDRLTLHVRGLVLVEFFAFNPADVVHALAENRNRLDALTPYPRHLAYWGDRDAMRLRVFEIDAVGRNFLERVNGRTSLAELLDGAVGLRGSTAHRDALRAAVRSMVEVGLLTLLPGA